MSRKPKGPPDWIQPQLATLTSSAPPGPDWLHEIKYDGYRLLARVTAGSVQLLTRNQKDWTARFPAVVEALKMLDAGPLLLDGEVAVELENGVTSFQALQNSVRGGRGQIRFFVFDLLFADGDDLTGLPLIDRKTRLESLLATSSSAVIRFSDHVVGNGLTFFDRACRHGLEGIISKRANASYRPGRGLDWLKVKCVREQEFVIGGFTEPSGSRQGLGALHVGAYDGNRLVYRGKVGTGFSDAVLRDLRRRLNRLERPTSPFDAGPRTGLRGSHWVEPKLVAQVRFTEWTDDGRLRHPSFEGLREDKPPRDVRVEAAVKAGAVVKADRSPRATKKASGKAAHNVGKARAPSRARSRRGADDAVDIAGVRLSSPARVVYPAEGITKLDLARYYERVGERMLPFIRGRPLTLIRCPDNIEECFFQKHVDDNTVYDELVRVPVREEKGVRHYPAVESVAGLLSLVQLGVVEFHTLGSRRDHLEKPDRITLDLDPDPEVPWERVVRAARGLRTILEEVGLRSFVKTTGGKGLHVVVPIQRKSSWEAVKEFSYGVVRVLHDAAPTEYTLKVTKARRKNRILLDYLRNARGSVAVEAYSARARPGAPVAAPVSWEELPLVGPGRFNVTSIRRRLSSRDPWADYFDVRQAITAAARRKLGL